MGVLRFLFVERRRMTDSHARFLVDVTRMTAAHLMSVEISGDWKETSRGVRNGCIMTTQVSPLHAGEAWP